MALSASITCDPPISPACRIASTPCNAASASGRIRPCVSEMTPIRERWLSAGRSREFSTRAGKMPAQPAARMAALRLLHIVNRDDVIHEMRNEQPVPFRVVADVRRRGDVLNNRGERAAGFSAIDGLAIPARNEE